MQYLRGKEIYVITNINDKSQQDRVFANPHPYPTKKKILTTEKFMKLDIKYMHIVL